MFFVPRIVCDNALVNKSQLASVSSTSELNIPLINIPRDTFSQVPPPDNNDINMIYKNTEVISLSEIHIPYNTDQPFTYCILYNVAIDGLNLADVVKIGVSYNGVPLPESIRSISLHNANDVVNNCFMRVLDPGVYKLCVYSPSSSNNNLCYISAVNFHILSLTGV